MCIPDLNIVAAGLRVLLQVQVDGEMGVDVTELVEVALGDTGDEVAEDRPHGAESGDVLPGTMVHLDGERVGLGLRERDREVAEVLDELAYSSADTPVSKRRPPPTVLFDMSGFAGNGSSKFCVPRGPSTVTSLDLMLTLTVLQS